MTERIKIPKIKSGSLEVAINNREIVIYPKRGGTGVSVQRIKEMKGEDLIRYRVLVFGKRLEVVPKQIKGERIQLITFAYGDNSIVPLSEDEAHYTQNAPAFDILYSFYLGRANGMEALAA